MEFIIRWQYVHKGVIANTFAFTPGNHKSLIAIRGQDVAEVQSLDGPTRQVCVIDNIIDCGDPPNSVQAASDFGGACPNPGGPVIKGGHCFGASGTSVGLWEEINDILVDSNYFIGARSTAVLIVSVRVTFRNNVHYCTATSAIDANDPTFYNVQTVNSTGMPRPTDIWIYGNTIHAWAAFNSGSRRSMFATPPDGADGNTNYGTYYFHNNLSYLPGIPGSVGISHGAGTIVHSNNSSDAQIKLTNPSFVGAGTYTEPADFMLNAGSYAIDAGVWRPGMVYDAARQPRSRTTPCIGAFED